MSIHTDASDLAVKKLREAQQMGNPEIAHDIADKVLCKLLIALGFKAVVDEWDKVPKWYA